MISPFFLRREISFGDRMIEPLLEVEELKESY
jgi:hypothetical protein